MKIKKGTSRIVFIFSRFVVKFPIIVNGLTIFYKELLGNCYENNYYNNTKDKNVSKCLFNFLGLFSIYERCYEISVLEFKRLDLIKFNNFEDVCRNNIMKDKKGQIKIVDYG